MVPVKAMGAPRMTQKDKWAKRPCVIRYRAMKDAIREAAGSLPSEDEIAEIFIVANFKMPSRWSKSQKLAMLHKRHRIKPDADNITKGIKDALFKRDEKIADESCKKRWSTDNQIEITITIE